MMRGGAVAKSIALTQQSSPKEDSFSSPYLVARREWDERYGGLIKRAQQWRATAILALLVALAEAIVIIGVATRPRIAPYVVAVDWTETQRTLDGKPISSDKWRGIFTVAINPSTDEAVLRVNPFGIYVMDITWSKVL